MSAVAGTDCREVDLHCHSTASDGTLPPAEVVARAAAAGIRTLALTDHDTVAGLPEAAAAARQCGVRLLPAVELSCRLAERDVHIVGLGIDVSHPAMLSLLDQLDRERARRAAAIARKLEHAGIPQALERCQRLAGHGRLTRTHFARLLVAEGHCRNLPQAFSRWLGTRKRAYEPARWNAAEECIDSIHRAGGVAILAHPMRYGWTHTRRRAMLAAFADAGGDAAEVSTPAVPPDQLRMVGADCGAAGLAASAGSDFHDPGQRWIRFGALPPLPAGLRPVWKLLTDARHPAARVDPPEFSP